MKPIFSKGKMYITSDGPFFFAAGAYPNSPRYTHRMYPMTKNEVLKFGDRAGRRLKAAAKAASKARRENDSYN
ncbi:MAG: hypothetical protein V3R78_12450 [Thermodesulfobacteriota bacterium]